MTVDELLNSMTTEFRESLWDIFIDDDEIEEADASTVKSEIHHWYIEPPYTTEKFFVMKMCIYTKPYMEQWKEHEEEMRKSFEEFGE